MTRQPGTLWRRRPAAGAVLVALIVALLALAAAGPVLANARPAKAKARPFACKAIVTSVDTTAATITAKVTRSTRPMKRCVGTDVTFTVTERTLMLKAGSRPPAKLALADFKAGDRVLIVGRVDRSDPDAPVFTARLIVLLRAAAATQT